MRQIIIILSCVLFSFNNLLAQVRFLAFGIQKTTSKHCLLVNPKIKGNEGKFVFADVASALRALEKLQSDVSKTKDTLWSEVYIAPSVYWLDNPEDTTMRRPTKDNAQPYALQVKLQRTHLIGLSHEAEDVVLAVNRGQTQGADGNFTMLHITGDDIQAENLTFGNYCNVDLQYKPNPKLSLRRRAEAIVQAQLVICKGKGYSLRNCRFISRLNLCPFSGADDVKFQNCYFECTDDALAGNSLYERCRLVLFSSKPFYSTGSRGARFQDCDFWLRTKGTQYITKVSSPVELVNCKFQSEDKDLKIEWTRKPNPKHPCLMRGCTLNGKPIVLPPTPDVPMSVELPDFPIKNNRQVKSGKWTYDAYCPGDLGMYAFQADTTRSAWVYGQGVDGAEGVYGLKQNVRGARLMFTADKSEVYRGQYLEVSLTPCKGAGQGFGSATGQYLDVCLKFNTRELTGYGIRFQRTVRYDHAVEVSLVEYNKGMVRQLTRPECCTVFKRGCHLRLEADNGRLKATITNGRESQTLQAEIEMNTFGGVHIQHTGSTGASATVIGGLKTEYH